MCVVFQQIFGTSKKSIFYKIENRQKILRMYNENSKLMNISSFNNNCWMLEEGKLNEIQENVKKRQSFDFYNCKSTFQFPGGKCSTILTDTLLKPEKMYYDAVVWGNFHEFIKLFINISLVKRGELN